MFNLISQNYIYKIFQNTDWYNYIQVDLKQAICNIYRKYLFMLKNESKTRIYAVSCWYTFTFTSAACSNGKVKSGWLHLRSRRPVTLIEKSGIHVH